MASGKLVNLQEKLTCSICLELLTEPFNGERRCPVFSIKYGPGNLWPHWHLANIVEWLREVKERNLEKQERNLSEDDKAICWLCKWSQEHCGHHTFLMEKVAQKNQWKLQEFSKRLRREQQENEKLKAQVKGEINTWKNEIQHERENIQELKEWQNLKTEEEVGLCNLVDSENELVQQSQLVRDLISDVEHHLQAPKNEMLQKRSAHRGALTFNRDSCISLVAALPLEGCPGDKVTGQKRNLQGSSSPRDFCRACRLRNRSRMQSPEHLRNERLGKMGLRGTDFPFVSYWAHIDWLAPAWFSKGLIILKRLENSFSEKS
ncbi:hypothetical protein FD754_012351 [Muntiacus muntjak]|uniref:Uncharacterized protein n=1 Tax=Muntiacus muntjak TaxID=9888 RepID=A0A5N3VEI1_MUNMU|nr:hypothetical protein FD754_012351 [Muntiacus muntjak]